VKNRLWQEKKHPRDRRGRFAGSRWAVRVSDTIGQALGQVSSGTPSLEQTAIQNGWDAPAPTGMAADLDRIIAAGGTELWRGSRRSRTHGAAQLSRQTQAGPPHYGGGLYGDGIYTSTHRSDAEYFATGGWDDDEPAPGSIQRLVPLPTAKILDYDVYGTRGKSFYEQAKAAGVDPGAAAAAAGYDGIRVIGGHVGSDDYGEESDADQIMILNRTAFLFEDTLQQ